MFGSLLTSALPLVAATMMGAPQQSAQQILETARERQEQRWSTVENYTVVQSVLGNEVPTYYEKILVGADRRPTFRVVPTSEYGPQDGAQQRAGMADAYAMLADSMEGQGALGMTAPMLRDMSAFLRAGETAEVNDGRADAEESSADLTTFMARAQLVGREAVDGREAFLIRAKDLSGLEIDQPDDNGKFTIQSVSLWIDVTEYVPLRLQMEGEVRSDGKSTPLSIEKLDQAYRNVGPLYEPHRQVLRMTGLQAAMDPKQRAEMERAQEQMKQMKAQLAAMPESQRRLIEGRMKPAMEQMERMSAGDGSVFETIIDVVSIRINEGPP